MREVLTGLSSADKWIDQLQFVWAITSGYDVPRYVDAKTLRSGKLGLEAFPDAAHPTKGSPEVDVTGILDASTYYAIKVVAVDKNFASPTGIYRMSPPTQQWDTNDGTVQSSFLGVAGKKFPITITGHTQDDLNTMTGAAVDAADYLWIFLSTGATAAEAEAGTYFRVDEIANPSGTTTWYLNGTETITAVTINDDALPPPYARFCMAAANRLWMCGGITETRGQITIETGALTTVVGQTSGDDQTYFDDGMVGGKVTIGDERGFTISAVDRTAQTMTISESYDGDFLDEWVDFEIETNYGLYYSSVDNPHHFPLENYVQIHGRPRGMAFIHRSVFVFTPDKLLRISADSPEQGPLEVPGEGGTNAPRSIVAVGDNVYFWDGTQFSVTDGVKKVPLTHHRFRRLSSEVDEDYEYLIVGGFNPVTRTIHWYYPTTDRVGCHKGIELHVDSGDVYPVWRPDVHTMWTEGNKLLFGNSGQYASTGPGLWEVDEDLAGDGLLATLAYRGVVLAVDGGSMEVIVLLDMTDGDPWVEMEAVPLTVEVSDTVDATVIVATGKSERQVWTEDEEPVHLENGMALELEQGDPRYVSLEDDSILQMESGEQVERESYGYHWLTLQADEDISQVAVGATCWLGIVPAVFGPKWLDFGSPRYRHKTYDLDFDFLAPGETVDVKLDWYENLGETPIRTVETTIAATQTKWQTPLDYRPGFSVGFRLRMYGRVPLKIMHYTVTWSTLR